MKVRLSNLRISHIATALPKDIVQIRDYEKFFDPKAIRRIMKSTGVEAIHIAKPEMCSSDYDVELAKRLMQEIGMSGDDFDGIVFVSQTPDYITPATSIIMQDRLGLPQSAVAFDINYGCSGYVYGLYQASLLVSSSSCRRVLMFTGDTQVRLSHEQDRTNRMILGDGFSATIVECGDQTFHFNIQSDGSGYRAIIVEAGGFRRPKSEETAAPIFDDKGNPHWAEYVYLDGMEIMNFALTRVPALINETLTDVGWSKSDVGVFAMHQANQLILQFLASRLKIEPDRMPIFMKSVGNTVSASIPLMLSSKRDELVKRDALKKVIMCGFGVGLSWGTVATDLSETIIHDTWII